MVLFLRTLIMLSMGPGSASSSSSSSSLSSSRQMKIESVWDYPRPAVLDYPITDEIVIVFNGKEVVRTTGGARVLETSHAPTYYVPLKDINTEAGVELIQSAGGGSMCEWKGRATYFDLVVDGKRSPRAAWAYLQPTTRVNPNQAHGWDNFGSGTNTGTGGSFAPIAGMVAFYASKVDECFVAGELSKPQDGDFYGGWINSWISGDKKGIKGAPGTSHF